MSRLSEVRMRVGFPGVRMGAVTCLFAESGLVSRVLMGQLRPLDCAAPPSQLHGEPPSGSKW